MKRFLLLALCVLNLFALSANAGETAGDVLGRAVYTRGGTELARADIIAAEEVPEITYGSMLKKLLDAIFRW